MENFQTAICSRAKREVVIGVALLTITMGAFLLFFMTNYFHTRRILEHYLAISGTERFFYNLIFVVFMYGSFTYQVSRLAFFWNVRSRVASTQEHLKSFLASGPANAPHVEILVPSYNEEAHVIWQALMSAALVDYPNRSVVLLIDNPPCPTDATDCALLLESRRQVQIVARQLEPLAADFERAARSFRDRGSLELNLKEQTQEVVSLYGRAASFLETMAEDTRTGMFGGNNDHTRKFFIERILLEPAAGHRKHAKRYADCILDKETLAKEFDRLKYMFRVRISSFERKQYANLSQAATKAANLNSYISLMGRGFEVVTSKEGRSLIEKKPQAYLDSIQSSDAAVSAAFPDAPYIIILDADSFLLSNYATCMISALQAPGNERVAVMQTPYTTIPDTPNLIEQAAAATTDIYYYVTEGMSFANAGSWIGAAAAIRKPALLDIVVYEEERGHSIPIYIQDTTIIEDTGATIDLARRGWSVQNYPARLNYSATPPDFGALVIQRRRWSNGGLIILPSVLRYLWTLRFSPRNVMESILRIHYMIMPACISTSMLAMLLYPFDFRYVSSWIYITLPPYLYLVCRDLAATGYRRRDCLKAYTLFLLLLPVVLSGVKNSIIQIIFGKKASFGSTPKVAHRTAAPASIHLSIIGLLVWSIITAYSDLASQMNQLHAVFALSNALALAYGTLVLIGVRETLEDIFLPTQSFWARIARVLKRGTVDKALLPLPPIQPLTAEQSLANGSTNVNRNSGPGIGMSGLDGGKSMQRTDPLPSGRPFHLLPSLPRASALQLKLRTAVRQHDLRPEQIKGTRH